MQHNYNQTEPKTEDIYWMKEALKEAQKAFDRDEVPVGCVVVANETIIARGYNLTETLTDVTAHAEMQAITSAASAIGGKYLNECTVYITLEPCVMCAGALAWAQTARIVWGADDAKRGFSRITENMLHPKTTITKGICEAECQTLLKDFFQKLRM